jgi:hypothetical protein
LCAWALFSPVGSHAHARAHLLAHVHSFSLSACSHTHAIPHTCTLAIHKRIRSLPPARVEQFCVDQVRSVGSDPAGDRSRVTLIFVTSPGCTSFRVSVHRSVECVAALFRGNPVQNPEQTASHLASALSPLQRFHREPLSCLESASGSTLRRSVYPRSAAARQRRERAALARSSASKSIGRQAPPHHTERHRFCNP